MSTIVFSLWGIQIGAKLLVLLRILHQRLSREWWGLMLWCACTMAKSLHLVWAYRSGRTRGYAAALQAWQPWDFLMSILLVAFIGWRVARGLRKPWKVWVVLVAYGLVGIAVALSTQGFWHPQSERFVGLLVAQRNWNLITLVACVGVFGLYDLRVSVNAGRARTGMLWMAYGEFASTILVGHANALAQLANLGSSLIALVVWFRMTHAGETQPPLDVFDGTAERRLARFKATGA